MPPNTLNAGMVNPNIWKIYLPTKINAITMIKATMVAVFEISFSSFH